MKTSKLFSILGILALTFLLFSCKKDDKKTTTPTIYFMDSSDELMEKMVLDGTGTVTTVLHLAGKAGVGIAYDDVHEKIYFSDFNDADTPNGKIWRMNLDTTGLEAIVSGILDPYGIALDVTGGKVYWADDNTHISRANLDGTSPQPGFITIADGWMRAVAIDKAHSKIYFYEVNNENLYVANLDGTNPTVLIPGVYGYAILIDTKNDKIYFDDQNTPALRRANLDGTGIVNIDNTDTKIYGMAIDYDKDKLYWTARATGEIYEANLNGTSKETLKTGLTSPRGMFLLK
jgi:DNA-binding beta-propeller fold protein YncE